MIGHKEYLDESASRQKLSALDQEFIVKNFNIDRKIQNFYDTQYDFRNLAVEFGQALLRRKATLPQEGAPRPDVIAEADLRAGKMRQLDSKMKHIKRKLTRIEKQLNTRRATSSRVASVTPAYGTRLKKTATPGHLRTPDGVSRRDRDHFLRTIRLIDATIHNVNDHFLRRVQLPPTASAVSGSLATSVVRNKKRLRDQMVRESRLLTSHPFSSTHLQRPSRVLPGIQTLPNSRVIHDGSIRLGEVVSLKTSQGDSKFHVGAESQGRSRRIVRSAFMKKSTKSSKVRTAHTKAHSRQPTGDSRGGPRRDIFSGKTHFPVRRPSSKMTHVGREIKQNKRVRSAMHSLSNKIRRKKPHTAVHVNRKKLTEQSSTRPSRSRDSTQIVNQLLGIYQKTSSNYTMPAQTAPMPDTSSPAEDSEVEEVVDLSAWKFRPRVDFIERNKLLASGTAELKQSTNVNARQDVNISGFRIEVHDSETPNQPQVGTGQTTSELELSEKLFDFPSNVDEPSKIEISKFPSGFSLNELGEARMIRKIPVPGSKVGATSLRQSRHIRHKFSKISNFNDFHHMFPVEQRNI